VVHSRPTLGGMKSILSHLVAATVAFTAGWAAFGYVQHSEAKLREFSEAGDFAAQMEKYSASARSPGRTRAEHALWLQLGEQLSFRRKNNSTYPADIVSIDAAYTYARLAELAKDRNDVAASVELLENAVAVCKQSKSANCQTEDLLKIVRLIDGKEKP
jgi:hypothetical protein